VIDPPEHVPQVEESLGARTVLAPDFEVLDSTDSPASINTVEAATQRAKIIELRNANLGTNLFMSLLLLQLPLIHNGRLLTKAGKKACEFARACMVQPLFGQR
jgi:hypothetical protein